MRPRICGRPRARTGLLALATGCLAALATIPAALAATASAPPLPLGQLPEATGALVEVTLAAMARRARAHMKLHIDDASLNVLDGQTVSVRGTLLPAQPGREVTLKLLGRRGWHTVAHSYTGARGRFRLRFKPGNLLSTRVEVRYSGDSRALPVRRVLGRLGVYRLAGASWYGGGGSLACGGYLTSSTMGVANKTLPCGTYVTLRYGGRSVRVPVVDRGPFVPGRDFDLTEATKRALGFEGVGQVWSSR
ncbi:MAG: septal ring lytic transglycosylase RlpA family protein [Solirubrobacteraceae bacterium]